MFLITEWRKKVGNGQSSNPVFWTEHVLKSGLMLRLIRWCISIVSAGQLGTCTVLAIARAKLELYKLVHVPIIWRALSSFCETPN